MILSFRPWMNFIYKAVLSTALFFICPLTSSLGWQAQKQNLGGTQKDAFIETLIDSSTHYINLPGEFPADIAKARRLAHQALKQSRIINNSIAEATVFVLLSRINRETGDRKTGRSFINKAIKVFTKYPDAKAAFEAQLEMAQYFDLDPDSSLIRKIQYQRAGVLGMKKLNLKNRRQADATKFLGDLYNNHGEYTTALKYLYESLSIYKSIGDRSLQEIHSLIATALINSGDIKGGLRHHLAAAQAVESTKDSSPVAAMVLNRLAITYNVIDEHKSALSYFYRAKKIAEKNGDANGAVSISSSIISEYLWLKRPQDGRKEMRNTFRQHREVAMQNRNFLARVLSLYSVLGEFKPAKPFYEKLLAMLEGEDINTRAAQIPYLIIIRFLQGTGNYAQADRYVRLLEGLPKENINLENRISLQEMAYKADSVKGNLESANKRLQLLRELDKQALKRNSDDQISRLNIEFETKNKDRTLSENKRNLNLLTQKNAIQDMALNAQRKARNLSIGCACLFALLLSIGVYQYKIKQRANSLLKLQKTEIDTQNGHLKTLVTEREWLLKEVHHRVKNNLQIIISLLNSQSMYLKDAAMLDVLRESQNRMNSISLIHQKLYQDDNLSGVYMPVYIHELVDDLRSSFSLQGQISFSVKVSELTLDVSQCVPLGLIINEAITNAIKYAFVGMEYGKITIRLEEIDRGLLEMEISDNGRGFPGGEVCVEHDSLGINLMHGLSGQLGAKLSITGKNGVRILLNWVKKENLKAVELA